LAEKSVFELRIRSSAGEFTKSGTGFVVKKDGTAITNFHVVQGAKSATAHFVGVPEVFDVDLIDVDPTYDLALIRVSQKGQLPDRTFPFMPLASSAANPVGQDAYAMGYPKQLGFTVTKGIVNGLRVFSDLPKNFRQGTTYAPDSVWIQTDCTINPGNSGGPLVNAAGEVLGVNTWKWLEDSNIYFALSSKHVQNLIDRTRTGKFTFSDLTSKFPSVKPSSARIPTIEVVGKSSAAELSSASIMLNTVGRCDKCKGTGVVAVYEKQVLDKIERKLGPPTELSRVEKTGVKQCDQCRGLRLNTDPVVERVIGNVAKTISKLDIKDVKAEEAKRLAESFLTDYAEIGSWALNEIAATSRKRIFGESSPKLGSVIMGFAVASKKFKVPDTEKNMRVLVPLNSEGNILFVEPSLVTADSTDTVFFAGLLAGFLVSPDGDAVPVIEHGFMVRSSLRQPPMLFIK
jgi:S1-C subfamily serine protease